MSSYLAVVFSELERGPLVWARLPRDVMVGVIAEYKYLAESVAGQYGSLHQNFTGDGHLFLFENADAAVQFSFKLIDRWKASVQSFQAPEAIAHIPLRIGCHFGDCGQLEDGGAWTGRGITLAKRVAEMAQADTVCVSANVLDVVDLPLYRFEEAGTHAIEGDHLPHRTVYRLTMFREGPSESAPAEPLTAEAWFLRGAALIGTARENSQDEAECYRMALRLRTGYPEAHNNLAVVLKARGDEMAAAEHYREASGLRPDYPEAHYNHAVLLQSRGSVVGAAEHYREALRLRPDYVDAHYGYATLLMAGGDVSTAEEHYVEALGVRPQYAEVHNNYAILLEDKGEPRSAHRHYQEALRIRPDYPEAYYNYAFLLENEGDAAGAEAHYFKALSLRPEYPEAHNNLAILLLGKGDLDGAASHYREALRLRPDDPETHYNYALLLKATGNEREAEDQLKLAFELAPMDWVMAL